MVADWRIPVLGLGLTLGLAMATLLSARRRQLPLDFVGRVKADAYRAMLRALLLLLAGLVLSLGGSIARPDAFPATPWWVAVALIAIGGISLLARAALYLLRIKPELDRLREPLPPTTPAARGSVRRDRAAGEQGDKRRVSNL